MKPKKIKQPNFVAKNAQTCGAGRHVDKTGDKAPRARQKRNWKRLVHEEIQ